ncbi:regulatory protein [Chromatocurvus halotolerans]|uniref:Regulatory protein RecX n=2 Tax=Chromatocurvus halotolerans TaxID=1132028 RepID=A0A4R2L1M3_9GAMM|nr:regulatory protein [Chromatocurvus halotolerans]
MTGNPDPSGLDEIDSQGGDDGEANANIIAVRRSAMDLLARREHARFELERKLLRRYPQHLIQQAVERLAEEGLQSDERFAESYVHQRAGRGYGPSRILRELQERGVDDSLAESILAVSGIDWHDIARRALTKKFGAVAEPLPLVEKARILRFLAYRGFSREHLPAPLG